MTTLTDHCVSLELAKQLKKLGVPQNAFWSWYDTTDRDDTPRLNRSDEHCPICNLPKQSFEEKYSAYIASELGMWLPDYTPKLGNLQIGYCKTDHVTLEPNSGNRKWWNVSYWTWENSYTCPNHDLYLEKESKLLQQEEFLPNAMAKMLIYLITHKLLDTKGGQV